MCCVGWSVYCMCLRLRRERKRNKYLKVIDNNLLLCVFEVKRNSILMLQLKVSGNFFTVFFCYFNWKKKYFSSMSTSFECDPIHFIVDIHEKSEPEKAEAKRKKKYTIANVVFINISKGTRKLLLLTRTVIHCLTWNIVESEYVNKKAVDAFFSLYDSNIFIFICLFGFCIYLCNGI